MVSRLIGRLGGRRREHGGDGSGRAALADVLDALRAGGELRRGWVVPRSAVWKATGVSAFTGAWGVLTGYAIFILWWERAQTAKLLDLIPQLVVAVGAALIIEWLRNQVRPELETRADPGLGSRIITGFVIVSLFELFGMAWESASGIMQSQSLAALRADVLGPDLARAPHALRDLLTLAVVWGLAGASLAGALGYAVFHLRSGRFPATVYGMGVGGLAGAVVAPLFVLALLVGVRLGLAAHLLVTAPGEWERHTTAVLGDLAPGQSKSPAYSPALWFVWAGWLLLQLVSRLASRGIWGVVGALALFAILVVVGRRGGKWRPLLGLGIVAALAVLAPLALGIVARPPTGDRWRVPGAPLNAASGAGPPLGSCRPVPRGLPGLRAGQSRGDDGDRRVGHRRATAGSRPRGPGGPRAHGLGHRQRSAAPTARPGTPRRTGA